MTPDSQTPPAPPIAAELLPENPLIVQRCPLKKSPKPKQVFVCSMSQ
jgi:hypothetical protein